MRRIVRMPDLAHYCSGLPEADAGRQNRRVDSGNDSISRWHGVASRSALLDKAAP